jgi:hypothetical protein
LLNRSLFRFNHHGGANRQQFRRTGLHFIPFITETGKWSGIQAGAFQLTLNLPLE